LNDLIIILIILNHPALSHGGPSRTNDRGVRSAGGPVEPISGSGGISANPPVAASHVAATTIAKTHEPVPVGQWFTIDAGPLPEGFREAEVWLDLYPQVIASRRQRHKAKISVQLLLKSRDARDHLGGILQRWGEARGAEIVVHTIDEPSAPSDRFVGRKDLEYVDQVYAHARTVPELEALLELAPPYLKDRAHRARYGEFFLNYDAFPPITGPPVPKPDRYRQLACVEFDTEWLIQNLPSLSTVSMELPLRRMEMLIRAHKHRVTGVGFVVTMWPTEGPVDEIIRRISRKAVASLGSTITANPALDETFGFSKAPPVWRIKLDLERDYPQHPKPNV
jgi:hypothetical protein